MQPHKGIRSSEVSKVALSPQKSQLFPEQEQRWGHTIRTKFLELKINSLVTSL